MWESGWIKYTWERRDEEEVLAREWEQKGGDITETQWGGHIQGRVAWYHIEEMVWVYVCNIWELLCQCLPDSLWRAFNLSMSFRSLYCHSTLNAQSLHPQQTPAPPTGGRVVNSSWRRVQANCEPQAPVSPSCHATTSATPLHGVTGHRHNTPSDRS